MKKRLFAFTMICFTIIGCGKAPYEVEVLMPEENEIRCLAEVDVAEDTDLAVKDFAVRLFQQNFKSGEDVLISPLSVLCALSMTANGADGETLAQMEQVFGDSVENLNSYLYTYAKDLPSAEHYKVHMANSIWLKDDEDMKIEQDFLRVNQDFYGADIFKAAFDAHTCDEINAWVSDNTEKMISEILEQIPDSARMYLINAIALDAKWKEKYEPHQVHTRKFTREDGSKRETELMYSDENLYLEDENATGFLKYYKGKKYAFAALLPNENVTVAEYVASLNGEKLDKLLKNVQKVPVSAALPKFEVEYDTELSEILIGMGMKNAFDDNADFSRMGNCGDNPFFISRVLHKTQIEVAEEGTKAAAATVVELLEGAAAEEPERKYVILDRPFVYMLIDCEENLPIFMGTLME